MSRPRSILFLLALPALPWLAAHPQDAVVLYDPGREMTCITDKNDCGTSPSTLLLLHQQVRLRVVNGQLLTRYVLHWGAEGPSAASFPILAGGPVQVLALDLPAAAAAKPDPAQPATKWTANAVLSSLLDPGDSATPQLDLERQDSELAVRQSELQTEIAAFNDNYRKVVGQAGPYTCNPATPRTGFNLGQCLAAAYSSLPGPAMDSQQFLTINHEWRQHFEGVQSFAHEFDANRIGAQAIDLESAILSYREMAEAFQANLQACEDAYALGLDMRLNKQSSAAALAARIQVRARLAAAAGASASAPSGVLEREVLADAEIKALYDPASLSFRHLEDLHNFCTGHPAAPDRFGNDLNDLRSKLSYLRSLVKSINDIQALAIERLNAIYQATTIGPIETLYNAGFGAKEEAVAYFIGVIHQFTPYTLTTGVAAEGNPPANHEVIVASGAFTLPGPRHRKHLLLGFLIRIF